MWVILFSLPTPLTWIQFSSIYPPTNSAEQAYRDSSFDEPSLFHNDILSYPISQDIQISNNQITGLRSIFGFVFPDLDGEA